jgi:hypothetical protein
MFRRSILSLALALGLACSGSTGMPAVGAGLTDVVSQGLMAQMGGMDSMSSLAHDFLKTSAEDGRLSGLLGDTLSDSGSRDALQSGLSNQLCSMLGGGCAASLTEEQIAAGAQKVNPEQAAALNDNLDRSLSEMSLSSALKDAVSKAIAPKLPGVIGALL